MPAKRSPIDYLARVPASAVKKGGWRGVMRALKAERRVVVTNHDEPEAVILSTDDYSRLVEAVNQAEARSQSDLETLRQRFDDRLAVLETPDAGNRLRAVIRTPAKLRGRVKAGTGY
jgi:PHD/YefM family antitoxin component YafN of YafNO toxin-antitoxin module